MTKSSPGSDPGIVIIYYRGRLVWLEGELTDPEVIGERTAEALRSISELRGEIQGCAGPDGAPPILH